MSVDDSKKYAIVTIDRVEFKGKWVEFWFTDSAEDMHNGSYHASSKSYKLMEAIDRAGIYDDIMSIGLRGRKIMWEKIGSHYEIVDFVTLNLNHLNILISSQEELEKRGALTETGVAYLNGMRQARKIMLEWTSTKEKESELSTSSDS